MCNKTQNTMKVLDIIRYICQHPEFTNVVIRDEEDMSPLSAITYLASIDPSHFDSMFFKINGTLEKGTLLIYDNKY